MVPPLFAHGVIEAHGKIPSPCAVQPLLNDLPGSEQVRKRDYRKVVHQGGTQHRRSGQSCRHAGNHLDLYLRELDRQLQHRTRHAVHSCIATANHSGVFSFIGLLQGQTAALQLLSHGGGDQFFPSGKVGRQVHIGGVAAQHLTVLQRLSGLGGEVVRSAGAKPNHIQPFHRCSFQVK